MSSSTSTTSSSPNQNNNNQSSSNNNNNNNNEEDSEETTSSSSLIQRAEAFVRASERRVLLAKTELNDAIGRYKNDKTTATKTKTTTENENEDEFLKDIYKEQILFSKHLLESAQTVLANAQNVYAGASVLHGNQNGKNDDNESTRDWMNGRTSRRRRRRTGEEEEECEEMEQTDFISSGMTAISALPTYYFDPTDDQRIRKALIPGPTTTATTTAAEEEEDAAQDATGCFPMGRYRLSLTPIAESNHKASNGAAHMDFTVQEDFGRRLKRAYGTFVSLQGDEPLPVAFYPQQQQQQQQQSQNLAMLVHGWFHCKLHNRSFPLGIIQFKSSSHSTIHALPRAYSFATNLVFKLLDMGLDSRDILIPILVTTGYLVQFACMYCEHGLPLPLTISTVLDTFDPRGRALAHHFMMKIQSQIDNLQAKLTALAGEPTKLFHSSSPSSPSSSPRERIMSIPSSIYTKAGYVSMEWKDNDIDGSVGHIYETLGTLWQTSAWKVVCPPLAFSTYTHSPPPMTNITLTNPLSPRGALLYINLKQLGYTNIPPPYYWAQAYIKSIQRAMHSIHECGVIHGNYHPNHVFWKIKRKTTTFQIKFIRWDTSFRKMEFLPSHIQEVWSKTYAWKWYQRSKGRGGNSSSSSNDDVRLLDEFMIRVLEYASLDQIHWETLCEAKNEMECCVAYKKLEQGFIMAEEKVALTRE